VDKGRITDATHQAGQQSASQAVSPAAASLRRAARAHAWLKSTSLLEIERAVRASRP
jgi:hypothetical protein